MSEKFVRSTSLPLLLTQKIESTLKSRFGLKLQESKKIAQAVQRTSDFYIENPVSPTPWSEPWCQIAQVAYYLPLNFLRLQTVANEGHRLGFFSSVKRLTDFGAGLSPVSLALLEILPELKISVIEKSADALSIAKEMGTRFESHARGQPSSGELLSFSYSLTELEHLPDWAFKFDSMMIVEPATRQDGRRLLEVRKKLLAEGYQMWAPCTHQVSCPLLAKSSADWCHDRIHFEAPDWWKDFESLLPFQNPTLTFSYLLASRQPRPETRGTIRLVGDFLNEKGKYRQMICRGPEREFLSWLKRGAEPEELPRGILIEEPPFTQHGQELRPQEPIKVRN